MYAYQVVLLNILIAPASPPTGLSVVWDPPSAVVSFQSPVYGGECVDYYVVTAVSEEENITCGTTSDKFMFNCTIPSDRSVYDINFTAYSVTRGGFMNGGVATDCCKHYSLFLVTVIIFANFCRFTISIQCECL